ncbi:MAG: hypothetical protein WBQ66_17305, partial [Blastocatellia bacterium]
MDSTDNAPRRSPSRQARVLRIRKAVLVLLSIWITVIVLLPIGWMIMIAFKREGQALKFQFVPVTNQRSIAHAFEVGDAPTVTLEYRDAAAQQVTVVGELTGDEPVPMLRDGALFRVVLTGAAAGRRTYHFVVDNTTRPDPRATETTPLGESVIEVAEERNSSNGPLDVSIT